MLLKNHFAERFQEMAIRGEFNGGKKVAYILISHGMLTWQMGNMLKAKKENPEKYEIPNLLNYDKFEEDGENHAKMQKLIEDTGHLDWTEDCKYMCMNAFAVKYDEGNQNFEDYRVLETQ